VNRRSILVFVGSRANYSSIRSAMVAIAAHPALELKTVVGASALLDRFGRVADLVARDGFRIDATFHMIIEGENPTTMAKSTGLGMIEMATILDNLRPDMVLVVGDRFEIAAVALAAAYMNIPIAHTMGGEVTGTIDESVRHAVTKLAHVHFPANAESADRIVRMGERPEHVFTVGCPRLDLVSEILARDPEVPPDFFAKHRGVGPDLDLRQPFLLVSQHPVTTEFTDARRQIEATLEALASLAMPTVMLWPNADAGSEEIAKGIRTFRERRAPGWLHLFINLPTDVYVRLMNNTACLIGNSSSAIREGALVGVPAVNVGTRQQSRQRAGNVIDVDHDAVAIADAIRRQLAHGRYAPAPVYGDGHAGTRIAQVLADVRVDVQKRLVY
jgi:UDP-hydrolysing UDP-N-acetyl-D-glucosamine 2-epimerase